MPVRIQEIHVKSLGPIERFSMKLGIFNLIYGHNEKGKTYLVEFLIRSLFRNPGQWQLRSLKGIGKVCVEGLEEMQVDFSPSSSLKIEDFWEKTSIGLPPDFSKLLVVKAAEVELANVEGGVDKAIMKRYLSSQEILDAIENRISKTVQASKLENNIIIGPKRGEISSREEFEQRLRIINQLFEQIDKGYSGGKRKTLSDVKEKLEGQIDLLEKAKRYLAFQINQKIKLLEQEKSRIDENKLQEARENIRLYRSNVDNYKRKVEEQTAAEEKSRHYEWLKSARELYKNRLILLAKKPHPIFLILSLVMLVSAGVLAFLQITAGAIAALGAVLLFGFLYLRKIQSFAKQAIEDEELKKLASEFSSRFDIELTGLPLIEEQLNKIEEHYNNSRLLKNQLDNELGSLTLLKTKISEQMFELAGQRQEPDAWNDTLRQLEDKLCDLQNRIQEKKIQLAGLLVDQSDYVTEKPDVEYSKQSYEQTQQRLARVSTQINEENQKLTNLKQIICNQTGDELNTNWETLIQNLREKREAVLHEYKEKTAEILGKMAVHSVLEDLRKEEDIKIGEGLRAKAVLVPLSRLTKRYKGLRLQGDTLIVTDPFHEFPLADLSTGAQEQVLLALRIGFAVKILKRNGLFLILDDAFQYSDWERREWLMDMMVDLAQNGWQIIYFTMDDHIKKLFDARGKVFGEQYKRYELS